jgi:hypothetical protein
VNVRDPVYGVPLKLTQISMNRLTANNIRGGRVEKRQNVRNTQEFKNRKKNR